MKKNYWIIVVVSTIVSMLMVSIINHIEFNSKVNKMLERAATTYVETKNETKININKTDNNNDKKITKEEKIYRMFGGEHVGTITVWSDGTTKMTTKENAPEWLKEESAHGGGTMPIEYYIEVIYNSNHTVYFDEIDEYNKDNLTLDEDQIIR